MISDMPYASSNGLELYYDTFGSQHDPALLLVMGLTAQCIAWDEAFCTMLADEGFFVIRFDNRDCGLSTKLDGVHVDINAVIGARFGLNVMPPVPYKLSAFSDDAFGLLDELGVERAHIVGASMGGMIVQTMAIEHPERVLSLTSIMSTTGEPDFFESSPEAMAILVSPPPADRESYIERAPMASRTMSPHRFSNDDAARRHAAASYDRMFYPEGGARQMAAVEASGHRADGLRMLAMPTLVVHGRVDQLILMKGGERTAELVPGATLMIFNDMGHDLPPHLWHQMTTAIATLARSADAATHA
jgi:pimeloyl-ACP methyl ester carboxylesterase